MRRFLIAMTMLTCLPAFAADMTMASLAETSASASLWRGHFSGGRNLNPHAEQIALDWTDQVAFFPSASGCRHWMRDLRSQYGTYQGFGGCLRIR